MIACAAIVLTLAFPGEVSARTVPDAVRKEWRIRRWALDPASSVEEIRRSLEGDWSERSAALDALARGLQGGSALLPELLQEAQARLADEHPTVRARALEVFSLRGLSVELEPRLASRLAQDRLPAVRLALARALVRVRCSAGTDLLAELAFDGDRRVARAARYALFSRGPRAEAAALRVAGTIEREGRPEERLEVAGLLLDGPAQPQLIEGLRELWQEDAALVEAVAQATLGESRHEVLVAGWFRGDDSRRRGIFEEAARRGDGELGALLASSLNEAVGRPGVPTRWGEVAPEFRERFGREARRFVFEHMAEVTVASLGGAGTLEWLLAHPVHDESVRLLLEPVGRRISSWSPEAVRWLAPGVQRSTREALVEALDLTFARYGDRVAGELLAQALADPEPELAQRAFRSLCDGTETEAWGRELLRAWESFDEERRAVALRWFDGKPPSAFRGTLLCAEDPERRLLFGESLAGFTGDVEVADALEDWCLADLERFRREPTDVPDDRAGSRLRRLLGALSQVDPRRAIEELAASLGLAGDRPELARQAAEGLALTEEGRAELRSFLAKGEGNRVEAALALAPEPAAIGFLLGAFDRAEWDQRERMLSAFGRAQDEASFAFLRGRGLDGNLGVAERGMALNALAARPGEASDRVLDQLASSVADVELRRRAIFLLGRRGEEASRKALVSAFDRLGELEEDERGAVRASFLTAFGTSGGLPGTLLAEWLREPWAERVPTLLARFRAEDLPTVAFTWRAEIALAASLARSGQLEAALAASPDWYQLDGRLLLDCAREVHGVRAGDPLALELARTARVALAGEQPEVEAWARSGALLLAYAWDEESWLWAERMALELLEGYGTRTGQRALWAELLGALESDGRPIACLRALPWQARAWSELGTGNLRKARAAAHEARERLADSPRAGRHQALLEAALAAGR